MKQLITKFKPANGYTADFITDQVIPKLNDRLPIVEEATQAELIAAISPFFAHGPTSYLVDCSVNPLFEPVLRTLLLNGHLRPDSTEKNVYRMSLPNSRLGFVTINSDPDAPKVETTYKTKYLDGTHSEVQREYISLVDDYPAVTWEPINPLLQTAYVTGKQDQPTKQYISLDNEKFATTILKADKEELQATYEKIIETATGGKGTVWRYRDGCISSDLAMIDKAVTNATIKVVGNAKFKFLAETKQNDYRGEISTLPSVGGLH